MKQKEYYWIGRFVCLLGYLFLALYAILNPWTPVDDYGRKTGQFYSLLDKWVFLIPAGFLILAIAGRRKMDIVCTILATLCCASVLVGWIAERDGESFANYGPAATLLYFFGEMFPDKGTLVMIVIALLLYTGVAVIAAVRVFTVKKHKAPLRILGVFVLIAVAVYVIGMFVCCFDFSETLQPLRDELLRWVDSDHERNEKILINIFKLAYMAMMVPASVCFVAETVFDRKRDKTAQ